MSVCEYQHTDASTYMATEEFKTTVQLCIITAIEATDSPWLTLLYD